MFRAGSACEAVDCEGQWERATVVDVGVGEYLVHFEDWSRRFDSWVSDREIRPRTETVREGKL